MPKFETHITCPIEFAATVERVGEEHGFKFSKIDGDALMGAKPYCYLTAYEPDADRLYERMRGACLTLILQNVPILREKIERIIYDTKTSVNELD